MWHISDGWVPRNTHTLVLFPEGVSEGVRAQRAYMSVWVPRNRHPLVSDADKICLFVGGITGLVMAGGAGLGSLEAYLNLAGNSRNLLHSVVHWSRFKH